MKVVLVAISLWLVGADADDARACAPPMHHTYEIVANSSDRTAPTGLAVRSRTERFDQPGCRFHFLVIEASASDDRPGPIGMEFRIASGTPPEGFFLPTGPLASFDDRYPFFTLGDAPYSFSVGVRAVDRAGNRGPERIFTVGGSTPSTDRERVSARTVVAIVVVAVLLVASLLVVTRQRRRRDRQPRQPTS